MSGLEIDEIRKTAEIIERIARDENSFKELIEAHDNEDSMKFHAVLQRFDVLQYCEWICFWICYKKCTLRCEHLCPVGQSDKNMIEIEEMRKFALEIPSLVADDEALRKLVEAHDKKDSKTFQEILRKLKLLKYCRQICSWLCHVRCRKVCILLCRRPQITHVGRIIVTQFTPQNYANGPSRDDLSNPNPDTPVANPSNGIGDHPFGGWTEVHGVFNVTNPDQYKVEYYKVPGGPWTPILDAVDDWKLVGFIPTGFYRHPSTPDGWYSVSEMNLGSMGRTYLTRWNTYSVSDGEYRLRLTVKKGAMEFTSAEVSVHVDNTVPSIDQPQLFIEKQDGSVDPLGCCGEIKKGEGIIQIHIRASDENFSQMSLKAYGGCSGAINIRDINTGNNIVSRTYNGNMMDKGESVTRIVRWDPWSVPEKVECCCYVIWFQIWDRSVVGNKWSGGHHDARWVSIAIC